jgi:hypothetical protein
VEGAPVSSRDLQRVHVRMLYDPALVDRVFIDADAALADVPLTADERKWLLACDRRLYTADPLRRRRSLKALLDEFKGSSALVVGATRRLADLDAFFSSALFHGCIQHRGSMAFAFADHLASFAPRDPRIAAVAALERALAAARRGRIPLKSSGTLADDARYVLAPHVAPVTLPASTLAVLQAVEQVLFEISLAPVAALADDGPNLAAVPKLADGPPERLLAVRGEADHVGLEEAPEELVRLLEGARQPLAGRHLRDLARALGAEAGKEADVVQPLLDDRLLVRA